MRPRPRRPAAPPLPDGLDEFHEDPGSDRALGAQITAWSQRRMAWMRATNRADYSPAAEILLRRKLRAHLIPRAASRRRRPTGTA